MSSRRKSRPVRRLDAPIGDHLEQFDAINDDVFDAQSYQQSVPTPEDSSQESNDITQNHQSNSEGIFILQPQCVGDNSVCNGINSISESNGIDLTKTDYSKKRQIQELTGDDSISPGLDLSVKRRKTEDNDTNDPNNLNDKQSHSFFHVDDCQATIKRFKNFVQLLANKSRSLDSEKCHPEFNQNIVENPLQSQLSVEQNSTAEDEEQVLNEDVKSPITASSSWVQQTVNKEMETWNGNLNYQNINHPSNHTIYNSLSPAVAAAMMASLVSKSDLKLSGSQTNGEVLQKLYRQSQSLLSQQHAAAKNQGAIQYSTSPDSVDTITAGTVSSGVGSIKRGTLDPTNFDEEVFDKYISRFNAKNSCMQSSCPHINRDHFHCTDSDCNFQRFTNKSDVIRHYNMHKKRDNSLAHGFMRFAPSDNCQSQFGACHLNGKSTHYHCLHPNCSRVYTSTSDVMTHENFHKKNEHLVTNGFRRYRATEVCDADFCPFRNQRTTHFHCTRPGCQFSFKNKCDIEKHKSYHVRDDAYTRQGFKKFYKNETCGFKGCAWNRTANHFHCLRQNCEFSFTSTGQMVSHKRKHDRQDMMSLDRPSTVFSCTSSSSSTSRYPQSSQSASFHPDSSGYFRSSSQQSAFQNQLSLKYMRSPSKTSAFRSFPYLQPFLGSNLFQNTTTPVGFEVGTSKSSGFDLAKFQEAARQVLAANISSSADTTPLPRIFTNCTSSVSNNFSSNLSTSSPSSVSGVRSNASSPQGREETAYSAMTSETFDVSRSRSPPPPYMEVPIKTSNGSSSSLDQNERYRVDNDETPRVDWPVDNHTSQKSPVIQNNDNEQVLNLSKSSKQEENLTKRSTSLQSSNSESVPSSSVLKYFRGYSPSDCKIPNCAFADRYHFHCVVENCNAAFTDKSLVFSHTQFHDKLEIMGISQPTSKTFTFFYPSISCSTSSQDASSPPPGYIALPITNNKLKEIPRKDSESQDFSFKPSSNDFRKNENENVIKQEAREPTPPAVDNEKRIPAPQGTNPVYEYISRIINENKSIASILPTQRISPIIPAQNPFSSIQNPAIASLVRSRSCTFPDNKLNIDRMSSANTTLPNDGYIHVRAGSACIRPDCKYVLQSHWHCTLNRCRYVCKSLAKAQSHRQAHDSLEAYARAAKECFKSYTAKKMCPNPNCEFRLRGHYHCLKPGCQFVTIGTSKLPWHMKKHEKIAKREASGFKYYTKKDQCGRKDCKYNGMFSHYHCIRAGCSFAFQYKHQMSTHVRKHIRRMLGRSYSGADVTADMSNLDHTNVDSGDDSLPLIVNEEDEIEQRPGVAKESVQTNHPPTSLQSASSALSEQHLALLENLSKVRKTLSEQSTGQAETINNDFTPNRSADSEVADVVSSEDVEANLSNDDVLDLRATNFQDVDSNSNSSGCDNADAENFETNNQEDKQQQNNSEHDNNVAVSSYSVTEQQDSSGALFSKFRLNNDVMNGFKRFEISENCRDASCPYSQKVSHYHCLHDDCNYRFTGRTHMYKHSQHHERVAGLVRNDFKRFKASQNCQFADCGYNGNSTHFHCLRCQFSCTDSAKVGVHRRQHVKADTLEQSGFERFRGKDDCGRENCKYRNRNTSHFHCLQPGCNYAVVGLSGTEQHSSKHKRMQMTRPSEMNFSIITNPLNNQADSSVKSSLFAGSPLIGGASNLLTYSVPFTALSSAPNVNNLIRPVTDGRSSVSLSFCTPATTSQMDRMSIENKPEIPAFINLSKLGIKPELTGNALSAGLNN